MPIEGSLLCTDNKDFQIWFDSFFVVQHLKIVKFIKWWIDFPLETVLILDLDLMRILFILLIVFLDNLPPHFFRSHKTILIFKFFD